MIRFLLFSVFFIPQLLSSQERTVGVFQYDSTSYNGYNLFSPSVSNTTYLIDNCGQLINLWEGNGFPGLDGYLLENGDLLRTSRTNSAFQGGGIGGLIEQFSWDGDTIWSYEYSSSLVQQHHDIEPLPNGNILLIAWKKIQFNQAIQAGRDTNLLNDRGIWPDHIVEVRPEGKDSATVVWEWHIWDHIIQDYDGTKDNFGVVNDHPELIDVNLTSPLAVVSDWTHFNSIDYIEEFDQILLSSRHLSEIYIIDHSTTTEEAASSSGGIYDRGGDILYRWGSDGNFMGEGAKEQQLFGQHHAQWISGKDGEPNKIILFNNGALREPPFSTIDVLIPSVDDFGNYLFNDNQVYDPRTAQTIYEASPPESFYNFTMGGVQLLPNDNLLICNSPAGIFFEVDEEGNKVWEYINPSGLNRTTQGVIPFLNSAFRVTRYDIDFPAFEGRDVSQKGFIEIDPIDEECFIIENPIVTAIGDNRKLEDVDIYPNLFESYVNIINTKNKKLALSIFNATGQIIIQERIYEKENKINLSHLNSGMIFLIIKDEKSNLQLVKKIIK